MRMSRLLVRTQRETPSDADLIGHQLLVRAGFLRGGTLLPLGLRVLRKLEGLVRADLGTLGAQEALFAAAETLAESIRTEKQLPLVLFQIATRRCDDSRPRLGLLRAAEYVAADVWGFEAPGRPAGVGVGGFAGAAVPAGWPVGASAQSVPAGGAIGAAIERILAACGLAVRRIGTFDGCAWVWCGDSAGSDRDILCCPGCGYSADAAVAGSRLTPVDSEPARPRRRVPTPGIRTVAQQAEMLNLPTSRIVKTLVVFSPEEPVVALVRGDCQVNLAKLARHLGQAEVRPATDEQVLARTGVQPGFVGPFSLPAGLRVVADLGVRELTNFSTGAGEADMHWIDANWGDDGFTPAEWADIRQAGAEQACPACGAGSLEGSRGTTLAVSQAVIAGGASTGTQAASRFTLGLTRILQTVVEAHHDADGIKWPVALAPYDLVIVPVNAQDDELMGAAADLYGTATDAGLAAVLDDRDERAGFKFKDADLIGFPLRITVGKSLNEGRVELKIRESGESREIALSDAIPYVKRLVTGAAPETALLKA